MAIRRLALLLAAAPLAGCAAGPDYHPAAPAALGVPDSYSVAGAPGARADLSRWWSSFDDPMLVTLVDQARTANLDVAQAVARLRQAREALVQARASLFPTVDLSASASRTEPLRGGTTTVNLGNGQVASYSQGATNSFSIGPSASYQVDLFGGVSRSVEASRAQYQGSGYDYAATLISIQSEVAQNYVLARAQQAQIANARSSLAIQDDNLQIAGWRVQAGLVSSLDAEQARTQRAQTAATIPTLESSYNQSVSRLAVLLGQAPGALKAQLAATRPIPRGPAVVSAGIPADVLRQRPDVLSAERALAAAVAQIGVNQAQLYPSLSIGGSVNTSASAIHDLTNVVTGQVFANIAQTIFDAGRTRSQVRSARAAADAAFLNYKQVVLTALEDVENAVVALQTAQQRERDYAVALDAANNYAILARSQYRAGLTDFTTLNTAESSLLSARDGLSQAQSDEATALIQLYVALGGGWDSGATPDVATVPATPANPTTAATPTQDR